MNPFVALIIRSFVAVPVSVITWIVASIYYGTPFSIMGIGIAIGAGIAVHIILSAIMKVQYLNKHGLTRKEYRYIKKNLVEAKLKIKRLNRALFQIKDVSLIKKRYDIIKITRKIQKMTKKEPKRFYRAEEFYFSHLDSIVELTEKYSLLSSQPKKSIEINQSLLETRQTLNEMTRILEDDLYHFVANDVDHLNFEIDVAKNTIKKQNENRWLKK